MWQLIERNEGRFRQQRQEEVTLLFKNVENYKFTDYKLQFMLQTETDCKLNLQC